MHLFSRLASLVFALPFIGQRLLWLRIQRLPGLDAALGSARRHSLRALMESYGDRLKKLMPEAITSLEFKEGFCRVRTTTGWICVIAIWLENEHGYRFKETHFPVNVPRNQWGQVWLPQYMRSRQMLPRMFYEPLVFHGPKEFNDHLMIEMDKMEQAIF